nr:MAG TPA: hypothetical protein [Caudoviricetes sp.]
MIEISRSYPLNSKNSRKEFKLCKMKRDDFR